MTSMELIFLPPHEQKLDLERNLGDALAAIMRHVYPHHTAKSVESAFDLDPNTAKNVAKGVAGGHVVTRVIHTQQRKGGDAWALWLALGELLIGEGLDAFEQREVLRLIEKTENAKSLSEERRRRRAALAARAAHILDAEDRSFVEQPGRQSSRPGRGNGGSGA